MQRSKKMQTFGAIAIVILVISQLGSYLIDANIPIGDTVQWTSVIHLTHIRNMGGVFGLLQGHGWVFAIFSVALLIGLTLYLARGKHVQLYEYVCFGFIAGGGLSNILDRLIYGSVVDFINVQGIPYWNYVFNTADVMVHVGLWPMLYFSIFAAPSAAEH